jgi:hypothetical protein
VTCEPRLLFASVIGCDDGIDENERGGVHGGTRCLKGRTVDQSLVEFVDFRVDLVWVIWEAWSTRLGASRRAGTSFLQISFALRLSE